MLSFTQIHGGNTMNVVPGEVTLGGTCRFLDAAVGAHVEERLRRLCRAVGESSGKTMVQNRRDGRAPSMAAEPS